MRAVGLSSCTIAGTEGYSVAGWLAVSVPLAKERYVWCHHAMHPRINSMGQSQFAAAVSERTKEEKEKSSTSSILEGDRSH